MTTDKNEVSPATPEVSSEINAVQSEKLSALTRTILWIATLLIFALGVGVRLFDLTDEPIDFHPTRQLRGAIIARGMYYAMLPDPDPEARELAISFWGSTGQYEPTTLENIVARTYLLIGGEQLWVARVYNTLFWTIGGIALFALSRRMLGDALQGSNKRPSTAVIWTAALVALAYYMLLPFGVQASRSFQPDPGMVMWIILAVYSLYRWSETLSWKWVILTGIFAGIAVLTKAVAAYIIAGAAVSIVIYTLGLTNEQTAANTNQKRGFFAAIKRIVFNPQVWAMALLMIVPVAIFYSSRGGRAAEYFNTWTVSLSHLLLDPETYVRWFRLVESLMGLAVLLLALVGILIARPRSRPLLLGMWIGYAIYGLFLPYQMYTHNYYHLQLIPMIALSIVSVAELIVSSISRQRRVWQVLAAAIVAAVIIYTAWIAILPQYAEDNRHERAYWSEIGDHLPSDGKIIGLTQDYGYRLMYYGWRKVILWPPRGEIKLAKLRGNEKEFDEYFNNRIEGKDYFLVTAFKQFNDQPVLQETLYERYPVYAEGPGYLIFDLAQPLNTSDP